MSTAMRLGPVKLGVELAWYSSHISCAVNVGLVAGFDASEKSGKQRPGGIDEWPDFEEVVVCNGLLSVGETGLWMLWAEARMTGLSSGDAVMTASITSFCWQKRCGLCSEGKMQVCCEASQFEQEGWRSSQRIWRRLHSAHPLRDFVCERRLFLVSVWTDCVTVEFSDAFAVRVRWVIFCDRALNHDRKSRRVPEGHLKWNLNCTGAGIGLWLTANRRQWLIIFHVASAYRALQTSDNNWLTVGRQKWRSRATLSPKLILFKPW